jgi:glucose/mannose-6-phosphate isomerase
LDDQELIRETDPSGMLGHIRGFPQHCRTAWDQVQAWRAPADWGEFQHILITGMGGSAIGGVLLAGLVADESRVPISVWRDYGLPAYVQGPDHLVVACSYSGNTEETLSTFREARKRGATTAAITTGGKLAALAGESDAALVRFDYESQPRAALGHAFFHLLGAVSRAISLPDYSEDVREAVEVMGALQSEIVPEVDVEENAAKQLARRAEGRQLVVLGAGHLAGVANRWKTQVNENAKQWAFFEMMPELDHNSVCGFGMPEAVPDYTLVVMLRSEADPPRLQARWDVTAELLEREGVPTEMVYGRGESTLSQMLSLIHVGDFVSLYLAVLNGVDPTPVEPIAFLKRRLAEVQRQG